MGKCLAENCRHQVPGDDYFCRGHWARLPGQSRTDIVYLRSLVRQGKGEMVVREGPSRTRTVKAKYRRCLLYAQRWLVKVELNKPDQSSSWDFTRARYAAAGRALDVAAQKVTAMPPRLRSRPTVSWDSPGQSVKLKVIKQLMAQGPRGVKSGDK